MCSGYVLYMVISWVFLGEFKFISVISLITAGQPSTIGLFPHHSGHSWCVWITEDIELSWLVGQSARAYQGFLQSPHPRGHFVVIWHLLHLFDTFSTEGPISHTLSTPVVQVGSVARGGDEVWSCFAWVLFFLSVFFLSVEIP